MQSYITSYNQLNIVFIVWACLRRRFTPDMAILWRDDDKSTPQAIKAG